MRILSSVAVGFVLSIAMMATPTTVFAQEGICGWCDPCQPVDEWRVIWDPECPACHRDRDYNEWSQECHLIPCQEYEGCGTAPAPEEEDSDFEGIEVLARDLKSDDPGAVMAALDSYGSRLTLSKERNGIFLFGGCNKDLILSFIPVSNSTMNLVSETGLKTPEAYLADLLTEG